MDTNLLIVATCLILESGGEGRLGMEAVNEVVWNRAQSRQLERGAICLQKWQFSAFNGVPWQQALARAQRHARWGEALAIAAAPVTRHTKGANHYCTIKTFPYWAKGRTPSAVIRNHKFYRL